jgi:RimJ/RimL family protein N-acetyltransferase
MRLTPLDRMQTPTLLLRPLEPADAPALFEQILGDADTMRDLPLGRHRRVDESSAFIDWALRGWNDGSLIRYAIECRQTGRLTAVIELRPVLPRVEVSVMTSYKLGMQFGNGEIQVLQQLVNWLLEQPGVYRVFGYCAVDGLAHKTLERIGFTREATLVNHQPRPNRGLIAADSYIYALTRSEPVAPTAPRHSTP